jgi:tRNA dimethylallyltransferase
LVVCGPTASGKSDLSDALSERQTELDRASTPTIVVDSMQVYRELPVLTNQARRRPAELVGVASVTEQWNVARHREDAEKVVENLSGRTFVLDAGTGMYLNAILLDIRLAPMVSPAMRQRAQEEVSGSETPRESHPRRAARAKELELAGARERRSIWHGNLRYETTVLYLRPDRAALDAAIAKRSAKIAHEGLEEAEQILGMLAAGAPVNPSVTDSVGVKELIQHLSRNFSLREAEDRITTRTRQLARRQMRWFDKLVRTLAGRAKIRILTDPPGQEVIHSMPDIIRA